ncbi:bifunctional precorrin-2 dehydrogenase/sirohydrochlorin ferrochelatase [Succinimonas sp.]|uniref:precorrin-2 dehydrogenase/sirohydrochlorin ferrochelatase family protein n=1 Tax=Succinimonas sp. TaxID=1936151 RepID=UPI00386EC78C
MSYFPLFVELRDLPVLVIGGGRVAWRKVEILRSFGAGVSAVAPEFCELFGAGAVCRPGLELIRREFRLCDLDGMKMTVAASGNPEINRLAAAECRKRGIPVNVADVPQLCDFYFPAVVKRGELTVGISSGGGAPGLSSRLREYIDAALPRDLDKELRRLAELRKDLLDAGKKPAADPCYMDLIDRLIDRIEKQ